MIELKFSTTYCKIQQKYEVIQMLCKTADFGYGSVQAYVNLTGLQNSAECALSCKNRLGYTRDGPSKIWTTD